MEPFSFSNLRKQTYNSIIYRDELKDTLFKQVKTYFLIWITTRRILKSYYTIRDESFGMTINMQELLQLFGIKIVDKSLNIGRCLDYEPILGAIESKDGKVTIYLEFEDILTIQQEKYTLAYLLGCYFINSDIEHDFYVEYTENRISQNYLGYCANIFATFLLLQPDRFFDELFVFSKRYPKASMEELLLNISKLETLSYHCAIKGYTYYKCIADYYNNSWFRGYLFSGTDESTKKELEDIFKEPLEIPKKLLY